MSIEAGVWSHSRRMSIVLIGALLALSGCATSEYTATSPMVRVLPSKGWRKPGATGEEAYQAELQCAKVKDISKKDCMAAKGFTLGKLAPDQVFDPPPLPEKGWVKPGVSYVEASHVKSRCLDHERSQEYLDQCMGEQGFVYRELTEDELPPCWFVGGFPPCKDEPRPYQ